MVAIKVLLRFAAFHKIQQAYAKHILGTPDKPLGFSSNLLCGSFAGAIEAALVRFELFLVFLRSWYSNWATICFSNSVLLCPHFLFLDPNREVGLDCTTFRKRKNFACRFSLPVQYLCHFLPRAWVLRRYESALHWFCAVFGPPGTQSSDGIGLHLLFEKLVALFVRLACPPSFRHAVGQINFSKLCCLCYSSS